LEPDLSLNNIEQVAGRVGMKLDFMTRPFVKNYNCDIYGAEDSQLVCLLEKTIFSL
jgi:hypothetical protein